MSSSIDLKTKNIFGDIISNGISYLVDSMLSSISTTVELNLVVPKNIYLRTKLLCEYIEEQVDTDFDVSNLLMMLYLDFIKHSIEKYDPIKIYHEINNAYNYNDVLIIHDRNKTYEYHRNTGRTTELAISIDKKTASKGILILEEIEDLYGKTISLERLLSILWISFIEAYKRGKNNKTIKDIIHRLNNSK